MAEIRDSELRDELELRREKLQDALQREPEDRRFGGLLRQVDDALACMDQGMYGLCRTCGDPIEPERLRVDPLLTFCLDHLDGAQRKALEDDLELASAIQNELLPPREVQADGWVTSYRYRAAGPVSGDYCDLLHTGDALYFMVGDVSGKGISAALLMSHLHATFRVLVGQQLPLETIMERASRMFCESSLPAHFATLACGRAGPTGEVSFGSAGHVPALLCRRAGMTRLDSTGLPLGMFCEQRFGIRTFTMETGDAILLCTDGVSETVDPGGVEYGLNRLSEKFEAAAALQPRGIVATCLEDVLDFRSGSDQTDDLTLLVVKRS